VAGSATIVHPVTQSVVDRFPFSSGETLNYKLSYRGLLTSMIWADIANVQMTFNADIMNHDQSPGHQFAIWLSTENYKKAELIHAVRYAYKVSLDQQLKRALLIEEQDTGVNQEHEILWLDWINKRMELYKRREKQIIYAGLFREIESEQWEADGNKPLPEFLAAREIHDISDEEALSYFIHKESGDELRYQQILDPLSLIYKLRQTAFMPDENAEVPVAIGDDIRIYRVEHQGLEQIEMDSCLRPAIKYYIHLVSNQDKAFYVWLSDDSKRIPLKFMMQAPLGKLVVVLQNIGCKISQSGTFSTS